MKKLDNLNKRDLISYRRLVEQVNNGNNEEYVCKYIPILVRFIEKNYKSDNNKFFELDDFIQECLIKLNDLKYYNIEFSIKELENIFNSIYIDMKNNKKYEYVNNIELEDKYYEIDTNHIDREAMFKSIRDKLPTDRQKIVLDHIENDDSIMDISHDLNIPYRYVSATRILVLNKIKRSIVFNRLYSDDLSKFMSCYRAYLLKNTFSINGLIRKLLEDYWTDELESYDYKHKCEYSLLLLRFFTSLKIDCISRRDMCFAKYIEEDINNILSNVDINNPRIPCNDRIRFNHYENENKRLHNYIK